MVCRFAELAREHKVQILAKGSPKISHSAAARSAVSNAADLFLRRVARAASGSTDESADGNGQQALFERMLGMIRGDISPKMIAENLDTYELLFLLSMPEPERQDLYSRLRCMHGAFSHLKAEAFLRSFPSKRMLMQWVINNTPTTIEQELRRRFHLTRASDVVARCLKVIAAHDLETGTVAMTVRNRTAPVELLLRALEHGKAMTQLDQMKRSVLLRKAVASDEAWTDEQVIESELAREEALVIKLKDSAAEQVDSISKIVAALTRLVYAVEESWIRQNALRYLQSEVSQHLSLAAPRKSTEHMLRWVCLYRSPPTYISIHARGSIGVVDMRERVNHQKVKVINRFMPSSLNCSTLAMSFFTMQSPVR